ncbi:MAG TPA: membrane-bound lytic murein transglycosylase MltF [Nevskiaceae bacterium]|nr:membrane-bound lytic murein transglycosylase MltF [Nevskiaceae bacterium]
MRSRIFEAKPSALRLPWLRSAGIALLAAGAATLSTCSPRVSLVDQVQALGALRVATVNSPTTYYEGPTGPTGFEYELADGLARKLGVRTEIVLAENTVEAMEMVRSGRAHIGAAGIAVTPLRSELVRFSTPIQRIVPQLVYRMGEKAPESLGDLSGKLVVGAHTAAAEWLSARKAADLPELRWTESADFETEDLLLQVSNGEIDYTIAPSDVIAINQRYYPKLRVAFALAESQDVAWALMPGPDTTLFDRVQDYLGSMNAKELARLHDRYFGHIEQVDYLGAVALATHVETRLPRYRALFEKAGKQFNIDWRMLAAIGYQESHWDSTAVSPTGVRGIMQLTQQTAIFLRVSNRDDPAQSIMGGARYIRRLIDMVPPEVPEPDRAFLALSAYNMGWGHLIDARELTKRRGGDPNRWLDVRASLPLLTQARWYKQTRFGYARGHEAETYVGNIRTYYDMLMYMFADTKPPEAPPPPPPQPEPADELNIRTPVL